MPSMDADTTAVHKPVALTTDPSRSKNGTPTPHVAPAPAFTQLNRRTAA
jgi:hypothetical protein